MSRTSPRPRFVSVIRGSGLSHRRKKKNSRGIHRIASDRTIRRTFAMSSFVGNNRPRESDIPTIRTAGSSKRDNKSRECVSIARDQTCESTCGSNIALSRLPASVRKLDSAARLKKSKLLQRCAILLRRLVIRTKNQPQSSFTREDDPLRKGTINLTRDTRRAELIYRRRLRIRV